uniref:ATPase subunit 8 n=1 Tax=Amblyomma triguttatum TaxID=65637 RepID=Q6I7M9_9ACAR|nr:ATP synthase F0 subunit 8 [Amblyomma triguttatum]BAD24954.1 ATPase subunit 8 [Amblyomma triguttatum]
MPQLFPMNWLLLTNLLLLFITLILINTYFIKFYKIKNNFKSGKNYDFRKMSFKW